jgi:hypothetical protein
LVSPTSVQAARPGDASAPAYSATIAGKSSAAASQLASGRGRYELDPDDPNPSLFAMAPDSNSPSSASAAGDIAQAGALAALGDEEHITMTKTVNAEGLDYFQKAFRDRGMEYVPSFANFVLVKVGDGDDLFRKMLKRGIILRAMSSYKLPEWVRISVGTMPQNIRCMEVLDDILQGGG